MMRSLGIAALALAGCTAGSPETTTGAASPGAAAPVVIDTVWTGESVAGAAPAPGARFQFVLGNDGRASGRSGCNAFSARYELNGTVLAVHPPMIGTMMACPEAVMAQEGTFREVLETAATAAVGSDGSLTVTGKDGRALQFVATDMPGHENAGATSSSPPMPLPSHIVMRCGAEQLRVRLMEGKAQVVLEDGSEVELQRLSSEAGAAETYTNGRMTLERTTTPQHGFRFARGRMVLMPCILAQN